MAHFTAREQHFRRNDRLLHCGNAADAQLMPLGPRVRFLPPSTRVSVPDRAFGAISRGSTLVSIEIRARDRPGAQPAFQRWLALSQPLRKRIDCSSYRVPAATPLGAI
jgi:hypothetical protein